MARIRYDRYLFDKDDLATITNTDSDTMEEVITESFTNPPIKMRFLRIPGLDFEWFCRDCFEHHNENNPDFEVSLADGEKMLRGELPGWRLVGVKFAPELGFWGYYVNEQLAKQEDLNKRDGAEVFIRFPDDIEVELEVGYADGLPARHYICKVGDCSSEFATEITEYLGKRKVRKLEYSESESGGDDRKGWLCHITEY